MSGRRSSWTWTDTVLLAGIAATAGVLRLIALGQPRALVFDEFYAGDACLYVFGPLPQCQTTAEISVVHPPLGKWLIGAGLTLFGFNPIGWRFASLVAGTLSVAVVYLLARRALRSTLAASIASGLLAVDFLHFVMSRTAMLDIFAMFFGVTAFLCIVYDGERSAAADGRLSGFRGMVQRPWLALAGIAGGAAVASKWSGAYMLAAVILLAVTRAVSGDRGGSRSNGAMGHELTMIVGALIVVPVVVYVASFTNRIEGTLFAWPWQQNAWIRSLVERHQLMLEHHLGPLYTHPYMSPAWSWLFLKRPVLFYFRDLGSGQYQEILAMGNPLVWWTGLAAVAGLGWRVLARRGVDAADRLILVGLAAGYLPWLIIVRQQSFLYYLLPALPFLYLAIARVVADLPWRSLQAGSTSVLTIATAAMFVFFYPLLAGNGLSRSEWERRMLFRDCGPDIERHGPQTEPGPPPSGWCWM